MEQTARFWDRIAERYAKKPVPDQAVYEKKLEVTRGYLRPDMDVLEIGCGTGSTAIVHAPFVRHYRATDISSKMLDIGCAGAAAAGVANVSFERASVEDLRVPDRSLDVVLGLSVLHLLENREAAIAKVYDMLKPGGVFVTSTACIGDTMAFFKFIGPIGKALGLIPTVKVFRKARLFQEFTDAGFKIDYQWQPGKGKAVFMVAKKQGE